MFRPRFSSLLVALSLIAVQGVGAQQTVQATLTSPNAPGGTAVVSPYGYYMSPYGGTVGSETNVRFNCVDFFHDAFLNAPWVAYNTNLGALITNTSLLSYTREGSNGLYSVGDAVKLYQEVAWLTDQFPVNPGQNGTTVSRTNAIQTAIWAIANNRPNNAFTNTNQYYGPLNVATTNQNDTQYWLDQAQSQYSQQASNYYDKFFISPTRTRS